MLITPDQIRAARALKNWSQTDLATRTGLAVPTIANIEAGKQEPNRSTLTKINTVFDESGVEFLGTRGVQKRQQRIRTLYGTNGFKKFMDHVYEVAKEHGGKIYLFNGLPHSFHEWLGVDWFDMHRKRMIKIKDNFTFRVAVKYGETLFIGQDYAEYRWLGDNVFNEKASFYVYGQNVALFDFQENDLKITILKHKEFAQAQKIIFDTTWKHLTIVPHTDT